MRVIVPAMGDSALKMAISAKRRIRITKYLLLVGICITFQAFVMQPKAPLSKPVYSEALVKYFIPPQLPERYWNTEPKEVKVRSKKKRIKATIAQVKAMPLPSLINPVLGATKKSIISFFGDARDGGRKHEGIDIVAPKGTIVIAPCEGEITEVGYNSLGGKVIRMRDHKHKCSYYFAHLDSQVVAKGTMVKRGDTLGTVGNTGNARRTRPHLHFSIYKKDGRTPVDYIRSKEQVKSLFASK